MPLGGGYANRVAWIDLTGGQIEYKPIAEEDARKYIGARGLGVKYVFDNGPQVEPLSPENILCFMNGPLTGTDVNLSGRMAVCTKSPLTGTVTDSHHGGWSAARLKWAGLRWPGLQGQGREAGLRLRRGWQGDAARCQRPVGQARPRDDQDPAGAPRRRKGPERHHHRPGRREPGEVRLLDERERSLLGPRRHGLRGRQQEPEGHRHQGQARRPPEAGRQRGVQGRAESRAGAALRRAGPHLAAQGRAVGLRHQRADEHHQQHGCAAGAQRPGDLVRRARRAAQRRARQGHDPGERPHLPRLPGRLQERGRGQGRAVQGPHGERRVRAGLVAWAPSAATTTSPRSRT